MKFEERDGLSQREPAAGELGNGEHARTYTLRPRIEELVECRGRSELEELYRFWGGTQARVPPADARELKRALLGWMGDAELVEARTAALGRRQLQILQLFLEVAGYLKSFEELASHKQLGYLSQYDVEASLALLARHGYLVEGKDPRFKSHGGRAFAVPEELGDLLLRLQRQKRKGLFDLLTLRGFLERMYEERANKKPVGQTRLREMYKVYANETAAVARIERLPDGVRPLVEKAILQFGGLLPRQIFERMENSLSAWDARKWRHLLEESLVGSVERLELARYGIQHSDEVLVVFNEVALAYLKRVAVPGDPDHPHVESSMGVDLVSNVSRFMGYILDHAVRFTVRGEIFKTTEKRILQELIPNPGKELSRDEVLAFIFEFARAAGLIESTGERTFALTNEGRNWESRSLDQKLTALVEFASEERDGNIDPFHQMRMRRIFLRLLKRVEPGTWYDLMYVPFLARNTYLSSLDQLAVDEYFNARAHSPDYAPMEDLQRMAWNLARWVRSRLYLLGVVDLGYDAAQRPVALRLTRTGARLLGVVDGALQEAPALGSLVVTPDFEVVLFPTGDDAELVHELDRFCVREKVGGTLHFRITERAVHRALSEGLHLGRILATLKHHSRTPVPQNVVYSIRDWAGRAGVLFLDTAGVMRGEDPEAVRRFQQDPAVKGYVREVLDERRLRLSSRFTARRLQALLRELGHLVELE